MGVPSVIHRNRDRSIPGQKRPQGGTRFGARIIGGHVKFHPITGREEHRLTGQPSLPQAGQYSRDSRLGIGEPFPELYRSRMMTETEDEKAHQVQGL